MAKIINECHTDKNIPKELKEEFFKKLRDLCCLYSVHIGVDNFVNTANKSEVLPTLLFEFHNGNTYYWDQDIDKDLDYGNCNAFINCEDENDRIHVNGVRFDQEEND